MFDSNCVFVSFVSLREIIYQGDAQYYHLAERKRDPDRVLYLSTRFVPLAGPGEDEIEEKLSLGELIPQANL